MRHLTQKCLLKLVPHLLTVVELNRWIIYISHPIMEEAETSIVKQKNVALWTDVAYFIFSCIEGLEYSEPFSDVVTSDEPVDEKSLLLVTPLWSLLAASGWFLWGSVAGFCPSSANFLRRFITVGRNLVDNARSPGSWKHVQSNIRLIKFFDKTETNTLFLKFLLVQQERGRGHRHTYTHMQRKRNIHNAAETWYFKKHVVPGNLAW